MYLAAIGGSSFRKVKNFSARLENRVGIIIKMIQSCQLTRCRVIEINSAGALPDRTNVSSVTKSEVTPEQKTE